MVETRFEELRREQDSTGEMVAGLARQVGALTTRVEEMQMQTKDIQLQLDEKWGLILGKLSLLEDKKKGEVQEVRGEWSDHQWKSDVEDHRVSNLNSFVMPRIDFPEFDGDNLEDWLYKCQRYFELEHIPENKKVQLASLYLCGPALQWHFSFVKNRRSDKSLDWGEYAGALNNRFGKEVFEDPMGKMKNLRQEGEYDNLYAYMEEFDVCLRKVLEKIDLPMSFQVSLFINGLKDEYKTTLWLLDPTDLLAVQTKVRILCDDKPVGKPSVGNNKPLRINNRFVTPAANTREMIPTSVRD
ncbi:hypothetical protein MLD38_034666 [Melastoma candidum]|uniref:Uncharacterized protein n=1 Tax=Melastoma candidum TaxID=119954 RepID=A0ACB9MAM7_9MYRT|nr:hypothetical protein MLD38_034666 [Melastoma candidum]